MKKKLLLVSILSIITLIILIILKFYHSPKVETNPYKNISYYNKHYLQRYKTYHNIDELFKDILK